MGGFKMCVFTIHDEQKSKINALFHFIKLNRQHKVGLSRYCITLCTVNTVQRELQVGLYSPQLVFLLTIFTFGFPWPVGSLPRHAFPKRLSVSPALSRAKVKPISVWQIGRVPLYNHME